MSSDVEVLIVSYASWAQISTCLASLRQSAPGLHVGIREHSSDPLDVERLRKATEGHSAPVRIEHDPTNPGFGAGCNALARSSTAGWLLFLNPDAELLTWPWSTEPPPSATVVGPTMIDSGHRGSHAGRSYRIRDEIGRSWLRRRPQPRDGRGFVSGAAMLIDAQSFRAMDGFDPGYFLFYEDIDFCLRCNAAGIPTLVSSAWQVRHLGGHSTSSRFSASLVWSYESGRRFHGGQGSTARGYATYVAVDALGRAAWHTVRRRSTQRRAYVDLTRRAMRDLLPTHADRQ